MSEGIRGFVGIESGSTAMSEPMTGGGDGYQWVLIVVGLVVVGVGHA